MPDDPQGGEEGQGGMQLLSPGEGRSLLGVGRERGDGAPLPTGGEILSVKRQGEKLLIPPAREPCLDNRVCLVEDASMSSSSCKHLAGFHPKPRTDCLSEMGAFNE